HRVSARPRTVTGSASWQMYCRCVAPIVDAVALADAEIVQLLECGDPRGVHIADGQLSNLFTSLRVFPLDVIAAERDRKLCPVLEEPCHRSRRHTPGSCTSSTVRVMTRPFS